MIEKPKRPKQPSIQERQPPRTLQELINRYDLDNTKIYDFLDGLVDLINEREQSVDSDISDINGDIGDINTSLTTLNNNKVNKSGDTLTGALMFNNKNDYDALRKLRTINNTDYGVAVGVGGNTSARLELYTGNTSLGGVDVKQDGIYNNKTGKKLVEENGTNFVHLGANSTQFSFSIGNLSGGYCTYLIFGGWANSFLYILTVHPSAHSVIGYNKVFNNTGEANITNATLSSSNVVTLTFSSTIWGGIQVIGEQAQST